MPYWLKGGIIVLIITLILAYFDSVCMQSASKTFLGSGGSQDFAGIECILLDWPTWPLGLVLPVSYSLPIISFTLLNSSIWFIFGSLIGAFVGYIKSKKKNSQ